MRCPASPQGPFALQPRTSAFRPKRRSRLPPSRQSSSERSATKERFGCKCIRFGIPFSRNPRNPDVGKLLEQGARFRVPGSDVPLANPRAAVYLVDHELRVKEHPDALDSATAGEFESFDESPILRNGVDGGPDRFGDRSNWVTVGVPEDDSDRTLSRIVGSPGARTVGKQ